MTESWVGSANGDGAFVSADAPVISAGATGFAHGHGLIETMRVLHGGRIPLRDRHAARLRRSAGEFGLSEVDPAVFDRAAELAARNGGHEVVRIVLAAGGGLSSRDAAGLVSITTRPAGSPSRRPVRLLATTGRRSASDPVARWKTTSRAFFVAAQREAEAQGADEALILSEAGEVLETTWANVFCRIDGEIVTPGPDGAFLPGIAREVLLEASARAGCPIRQRSITLDELRGAEGVWISNAVHGPRAACLIDAPSVSSDETELALWWRDSLRPAPGPGR